MELVEVAFECEFFVGPNPTETFNEFSAASIALGMLEPPLSYASELCLEPAGHDVDGDTSVGVVVDASNLFGCYGGVPWAWEESSDYIQLLGCV